MKGFKSITFILCVFIFTSCVEKTNKEMHEMVQSKEHDERLYGWWQLINNEKQYNFFDNVEFKFLSGERKYNGDIEKKTSYYYWYTESDNTLYTLRDVSLFYGNMKSSMEYIISDDGNTLSFKEGESYVPAYNKVR